MNELMLISGTIAAEFTRMSISLVTTISMAPSLSSRSISGGALFHGPPSHPGFAVAQRQASIDRSSPITPRHQIPCESDRNCAR